MIITSGPKKPMLEYVLLTPLLNANQRNVWPEITLLLTIVASIMTNTTLVYVTEYIPMSQKVLLQLLRGETSPVDAVNREIIGASHF